jgi:chitinase
MFWSRRLVVAVGVIGVAVSTGSVGVQAASRPAALPAHVFAPYFETYLPSNLARLSQESGARYLTLAFLQTPAKGSCKVDWNGDVNTPVSTSMYGSAIARIRAAGGDVLPSFGGYSADHGGTEIADSCASVSSIASTYEQVATTYNVTRIDLDVEDRSLNDVGGITRRNQAIAMAETWAREQHRTLQFVYTIPTNDNGIGSQGRRVLKSAVDAGARIDIVNIMTFDYYADEPHQMADSTRSAAAALYAVLRNLHPRATPARLWGMIGVTEMIGIDDYGPQETLTLHNARGVERWADQHGIAELSFWALQRDDGRCPGTAGSNTCSGVTQQPWQYSNTFEPFTRSS